MKKRILVVGAISLIFIISMFPSNPFAQQTENTDVSMRFDHNITTDETWSWTLTAY